MGMTWLSGGRLVIRSSGELVISDLEVADTGNYTCAIWDWQVRRGGGGGGGGGGRGGGKGGDGRGGGREGGGGRGREGGRR